MIFDQHKKLKEFRKAEGMTQIEFVEFINNNIGGLKQGKLTQGNLVQMEKGDRPVPSEYVKIMRDKKKLNYSWWFDSVGKRTIDGKDKNTMTTDVSKIRQDYEYLEAKYLSLEKVTKQLYGDFYELVNKLNIK